MQIVDISGQPDGDGYLATLSHYQSLARQEERSGPCEDDVEVTAPYVDGMPDGVHPDEFLSRPLKFGDWYEWERQQAALKAADEALLNALYASDVDDMLRRAAKKRNEVAGLTEEQKTFVSSVW